MTRKTETLVILIGASEFPYSKQFENILAFEKSAEIVTDYFLSNQHFNLNGLDYLNLFNSNYSSNDQGVEIETFIKRKHESQNIKNLIFYYIGHGGIHQNDQYYLSIKTTNDDHPYQTSLSTQYLAEIINSYSNTFRCVLILDCCFAGSAIKDFLTIDAKFKYKEIKNYSGVAILCASNKNKEAEIRKEKDFTIFSYHAINILKNGAIGYGEYLTLRNLNELLSKEISDNYPEKELKPELHVPAQSNSDISTIGILKCGMEDSNITSSTQTTTLNKFIKDLYFTESFYNKLSNIENWEETYSSIFWNFFTKKSLEELSNKGISESKLINELTQLIIVSESQIPIIVEGLAGTGKSILISLLYQKLLSIKPLDYIPIYIDLTYYERKIYKNENIEYSAISLLKDHLDKMLSFKECEEKKIILLVNGADEHIKSKVDIFPIIEEYQVFSKKVIGIKRINDLDENKRPIYINSTNTYDLELEIKPIRVKSNPNLDHIITNYSQITKTLIHKPDLPDLFLKKIKQLSLHEIDMFTLRVLSISIIESTVYNSVKSFHELLVTYCKRILFKDDLSIEQTSKIAFTIFNLRKRYDAHEINNKGWNLIHSHQSIRNMLIANQVMAFILDKEFKEIDSFNFVYPSEVNTFIKNYIETNRNKQNELYDCLIEKWSLINDNTKYISALTHFSYIIGRFTEPDVATQSIDFLKKIKISTHFKSLYKRVTNYKRGDFDYLKLNLRDKQALLYLRTIYISLIYLGDKEISDEYISFCIQNPYLENLNRGFHLEYYGDIPYLPGEEDSLKHIDNLEPITLTFTRLSNKILSAIDKRDATGVEYYPMFSVEIFTLCSLVLKRSIGKNGFLADYYRDTIEDIINKIICQKVIKKDSCLMGHLKFIKRFVCDYKDVDEVNLFNLVYYLKNRPRKGWYDISKFDLPELEVERVSSHTWGAESIAYFFLKEYTKNDDKPSRLNKDRVIKMLHFHDIAESFTSDLLKEEKEIKIKNYNSVEKEWLRVISNYGMVEAFADTSYIYDLITEFNEGKTFEAQIARDCDKLECFLQLKNLYLRGKLKDKPDIYKEFKENLTSDFYTDWGRKIFELFDRLNADHFELEDDNKILQYKTKEIY